MTRQQAERTGRAAETIALWWLRLKGFHLLARDWRSPVGEIDLIVARKRMLVFVEVKQRGTIATAHEALGPRQRTRITRAADAFVAGRQTYANHTCRFDAILIAPGRLPLHIADAWQIG